MAFAIVGIVEFDRVEIVRKDAAMGGIGFAQAGERIIAFLTPVWTAFSAGERFAMVWPARSSTRPKALGR